ncbi:MAG: hypothetical protein E6R03_07070 [Hyphomicrobiaceae bacterium]|nr:MAG: hypothetical protein E6R03_07070 [Hyphomicrobiaceae bacterium]
MAKTFEPQTFDFEVDGRAHVIEFDREALKIADSMGVMSNDGMGLLDKTITILYVGMLKNEPFMTPKRASEIFYKYLDGEDCSMDDFSEIIDEFTRCWKAVFTASGKKNKIQSRQSKAAQKKA